MCTALHAFIHINQQQMGCNLILVHSITSNTLKNWAHLLRPHLSARMSSTFTFVILSTADSVFHLHRFPHPTYFMRCLCRSAEVALTAHS